MAEPVIPFAEGSPPDELQVETLPDGDVLIGDPILDTIEDSASNFDINLAEDLDEREASRKAGILTGYFENDEQARSEWKERYKQGLMTLDPEGGMDENEEERAVVFVFGGNKQASLSYLLYFAHLFLAVFRLLIFLVPPY